MGVVYSSEKLAARSGDSSTEMNAQLLRSSSSRIRTFTSCYIKYRYPPIVDNINLHSYFMNVERTGELEGGHADLVSLLWAVFEVKSMYVRRLQILCFSFVDNIICYRCYIQEIISCLILLSEETWHNKLSLLFDVFAGSPDEEIGYDDIVIIAQVIAIALHRLWLSPDWNQAKWSQLCEALADGAFAKVGALHNAHKHLHFQYKFDYFL